MCSWVESTWRPYKFSDSNLETEDHIVYATHRLYYMDWVVDDCGVLIGNQVEYGRTDKVTVKSQRRN